MLFEIFEVLADKAGKEAYYNPGDRLFVRGEEVSAVFLLDAGEVKLARSLPKDREVVLQRLRGPAVVAEASLYAERYAWDAICLSACSVRRLAAPRFLSLIEESAVLSSAWAAHLAQSLEDARVRAEILTLKTAGERFDAWCAWRGGKAPADLDPETLAAELRISQKTLARILRSL